MEVDSHSHILFIPRKEIHLIISQQIRQIQTKELQQNCRKIYTVLRNKHSNKQNTLHRYEYCKQNREI